MLKQTDKLSSKYFIAHGRRLENSNIGHNIVGEIFMS